MGLRKFFQSASSLKFKTKKPKAPLINAILVKLPPEIHIEILSYLSLFDQGAASQVCGLWRSIILRSGERFRYSQNGPLTFHKLLTDPGWRGCIIHQGAVLSWSFLGDDESVESHTWRHKNARKVNVFTSGFLNEPAIAPSSHIESLPCSLRVIGSCVTADVRKPIKWKPTEGDTVMHFVLYVVQETYHMVTMYNREESLPPVLRHNLLFSFSETDGELVANIDLCYPELLGIHDRDMEVWRISLTPASLLH
ncbi:hypothetical protein H072_10192 [Dactylellina haptotyla CBS 200.50]|uniref:F-box domain-containing protein n=1 Tax=Dactylellina haptotyla (strain CBS 200.50) TaxID=1284197 RepID=S8BAZ4_DACHA|nr:hypothetical protein H072_10192 [Dactylellina haptotyla CBS 200.50]